MSTVRSSRIVDMPVLRLTDFCQERTLLISEFTHLQGLDNRICNMGRSNDGGVVT